MLSLVAILLFHVSYFQRPRLQHYTMNASLTAIKKHSC